MSQAQVANALEMKRPGYNAYELGTVTPPAEKLTKLAALFEVSVDYLLGRPTPAPDAALAQSVLTDALHDACRADLNQLLAEAKGDTKRLMEIKAALEGLRK